MWDAFWKLNQSRISGFNGPNPIQISEIISYAKAFNIDNLEEFVSYIQLLDYQLLTYVNKKHKKGKHG